MAPFYAAMTRLVAAAALTDADFYPEYCDLDIDPNEFEGTARERFIHILSNASPKEQAATVYSPGFGGFRAAANCSVGRAASGDS
jgi:hypothetical protein